MPREMGSSLPSLRGRRRAQLTRRTVRACAIGVASVLVVTFGGAAPASAPLAGLSRSAAKAANPMPASLRWALPDSPVGRQLEWLVTAASRPPIPTGELRAHFDASFLSQVAPQTLNDVLVGLHASSGWRLVTLDASTTPGVLLATIVSGSTRFGVEVSTDDKGLIGGLFVQPAPALPSPPTSWHSLDVKLSALAPDVSFEVATLSAKGACIPVHSLLASTARPLGSMFKLFVLGAVDRAVRTGSLTWGRSVTLAEDLMSLPSGVLQVEPAGTSYSVAQYAEIMISSSDNTAADRLAALVGRGAVGAQVRRWSTHAALDTPFLRTRELFVLKYADWPRDANAYLALSPSARADYLGRVVDEVPLSAVNLGQVDLAAPHAIDEIEWFASPADLCRAFAGLYADAQHASLAPIRAAMSLNDGGLGLSAATWPLVWFKGGSETGVLTLGYLARNRDGEVVIAVALLSNPNKAIVESTVSLALLAIVRGAFKLAS